MSVAILLSSQLFIAAAALTSLVLAAVSAERTRADEALRSSSERLRSIVQSMADGLIVRDVRGLITTCNAAAEQTRARAVAARGSRPRSPSADYLTVSVPCMPAARWPSTEQ